MPCRICPVLALADDKDGLSRPFVDVAAKRGFWPIWTDAVQCAKVWFLDSFKNENCDQRCELRTNTKAITALSSPRTSHIRVCSGLPQ